MPAGTSPPAEGGLRAHRFRAELSARLGERREEIEQAASARIHAIHDPRDSGDPEYVEGLRAAVSAALDYALAAIERGEERAPDLPAALLVQARVAARNGVSLDTVLRRYFAGYTLLGDFVMREVAEEGTVRVADLRGILGAQAALFDRLIAVVTEEYGREVQARPCSSEERRAERIERLLDGELVDISELQYDFGAWHVGMIAVGPGAVEAIRGLSGPLDRCLLVVGRAEGAAWGWLAGRRPLQRDDLRRTLSHSWPLGLSLAIGEPAEGIAGWRLTHRQAKAALPIALRRKGHFVPYAEVALLASVLQDDLLAASLRQLYLAPLERERDGGEVMRETLRAYFAAERNVSSAAAALGVSRRTVGNRLAAIEARLGCSLAHSAAEIEAALCLEDLPELSHIAW